MVRWSVAIVCMLLSVGGCGGADDSRGQACTATAEEQLGCLREVGFGSIDGAEVSDVNEEQGMDTLVRFRLQGPTAAIDETLRAAEFTTPTAPGSNEFQLEPDADISGLDDVRSASDVWMDTNAVPIHRQVLRGRLRSNPDEEVLLVRGFTT